MTLPHVLTDMAGSANRHTASLIAADSKARLVARTVPDDGTEIAVLGSPAPAMRRATHSSRVGRNDGRRKGVAEGIRRSEDRMGRDRTCRRLCRLWLDDGCHDSEIACVDSRGCCGEVQPETPLADRSFHAADLDHEAIESVVDDSQNWVRGVHLANLGLVSLVCLSRRGQTALYPIPTARHEVARTGGGSHACNLLMATTAESSRGILFLSVAYLPPRVLALSLYHSDIANQLNGIDGGSRVGSQPLGADQPRCRLLVPVEATWLARLGCGGDGGGASI